MSGTCRPHKGFHFYCVLLHIQRKFTKICDFKAVTNWLPFCTKCALDKDGNIFHFQ